MKKFDDFIKTWVVKIRTPNKSIARDLVEEAERKYDSLKETLKKVGLSNKNANDFIESCYDILIYLIRAKLYIDGYKCTGAGAHEAEICYLLELGFSEKDMRIIDELRYFRNRIKYYGKRFDEKYAKKVFEFLEKNYFKLKGLISF